MSTRASKPVYVAVAVLCLLALVIGLSRCRQAAHGGSRDVPALSKYDALLSVRNDGAADWEISFASEEADEPVVRTLAAGEKTEMTLRAGRYRVEQRLLATEPGRGLTRHFELQLQGGKKYRWQLVSVLSAGTADLEDPPEEGGAR